MSNINIETLYYIVTILAIIIGAIVAAYKIGFEHGKNSKE